MKTIKVIDLLSDLSKYAINIKNKRIRYFDKNNDYYDECPLKEQEIIYRLYYGNIRLNNEVEIIEDTPKEDKKIEELSTWFAISDEPTLEGLCKYIDHNNEQFYNKINELVRKINGDK